MYWRAFLIIFLLCPCHCTHRQSPWQKVLSLEELGLDLLREASVLQEEILSRLVRQRDGSELKVELRTWRSFQPSHETASLCQLVSLALWEVDRANHVKHVPDFAVV